MKNELNIKFLHDCLLIKDILVIGDIHIGYDEKFQVGSVFLGMQLKEILEKLNDIFNYLEKEKIKKIILLGDVKHDFGTITDIEWRETLEFFDFLKNKLDGMDKLSNMMVKKEVSNKALANSRFFAKINKNDDKDNKDKLKNKIIVIKGNHDNILMPIIKKGGIRLVDYYCIKINKRKICFLHGDRLFKQCLDSQTDVLVFGHLHPSITIYDKYKAEKYKCFLRGKWKINGRNREVYILPGFSSVSFGYDLRNIDNINVKGKIARKKNTLNFFNRIKDKLALVKKNGVELYGVKKDKNKFFVIPNNILKNFEVIIYNNKEKKEYNFGKLKRLIE